MSPTITASISSTIIKLYGPRSHCHCCQRGRGRKRYCPCLGWPLVASPPPRHRTGHLTLGHRHSGDTATVTAGGHRTGQLTLSLQSCTVVIVISGHWTLQQRGRGRLTQVWGLPLCSNCHKLSWLDDNECQPQRFLVHHKTRQEESLFCLCPNPQYSPPDLESTTLLN